MPFEKHFDEMRPATASACIFLRSKAMYVTGDLRNPNHPDEAGSQYCWCNRTQHVLGPDQHHVNRQDCVLGRDCFQESY